MLRTKKRAIIAAVLSLLTIGSIATPAGAAPNPSAPPADRAGTDAVPFCYGSAAPDPQYSASNNRVHWGVKGNCNYTAELYILTRLWTIVGSGDHERMEFQLFDDNHCVATNCIAGGNPICLVRTTGRWIVEGSGTVNGAPMKPFPDWGPVVTLPCSDVGVQ